MGYAHNVECALVRDHFGVSGRSYLAYGEKGDTNDIKEII